MAGSKSSLNGLLNNSKYAGTITRQKAIINAVFIILFFFAIVLSSSRCLFCSHPLINTIYRRGTVYIKFYHEVCRISSVTLHIFISAMPIFRILIIPVKKSNVLRTDKIRAKIARYESPEAFACAFKRN